MTCRLQSQHTHMAQEIPIPSPRFSKGEAFPMGFGKADPAVTYGFSTARLCHCTSAGLTPSDTCDVGVSKDKTHGHLVENRCKLYWASLVAAQLWPTKGTHMGHVWCLWNFASWVVANVYYPPPPQKKKKKKKKHTKTKQWATCGNLLEVPVAPSVATYVWPMKVPLNGHSLYQ